MVCCEDGTATLEDDFLSHTIALARAQAVFTNRPAQMGGPSLFRLPIPSAFINNEIGQSDY